MNNENSSPEDPITFYANLEQDQLMAGQPISALNCQIGIKPNASLVEDHEVSTTTSICLIFDCSVSMMGDNFKAAIETAKMIVDILGEKHRLSLVAFGSASSVVFENLVPTDKAKTSIKKQIENLRYHLGGTTNMAAGIYTGMNVLSEVDIDADVNVMVLLSDGVADSAEKAQMAADEVGKKGYQLYAVGMGPSYQADQLIKLVTPSNGSVFGDSDVDKISIIFRDIIYRIDRIFATKVKLAFTFSDRVSMHRLVKTSPERALYNVTTVCENQQQLYIGNIESDKHYKFLVQFNVEPFQEGRIELIKVELQYDVLLLNQVSQKQEIILNVDFVEHVTSIAKRDESISQALRSISMIELSDELMGNYQSNGVRAKEIIKQLRQQCNEEKNEELKQHLNTIEELITKKRRVSDKVLNDFLLASIKTPGQNSQANTSHGQMLYDLILVDPGEETIRLVRLIRDVTGLSVKEIAHKLERKHSKILAGLTDESQALSIQKQLEEAGAEIDVEVHKSQPNEKKN